MSVPMNQRRSHRLDVVPKNVVCDDPNIIDRAPPDSCKSHAGSAPAVDAAGLGKAIPFRQRSFDACFSVGNIVGCVVNIVGCVGCVFKIYARVAAAYFEYSEHSDQTKRGARRSPWFLNPDIHEIPPSPTLLYAFSI